jgi:hypothetical protein
VSWTLGNVKLSRWLAGRGLCDDDLIDPDGDTGYSDLWVMLWHYL